MAESPWQEPVVLGAFTGLLLHAQGRQVLNHSDQEQKMEENPWGTPIENRDLLEPHGEPYPSCLSSWGDCWLWTREYFFRCFPCC